MRRWIYGVGFPEGNEAIYVKRFEGHIEGVREYFKDRPEDLLVLDLPKGDGGNKMCPFLGVDIPNALFPHANKSRDRGNANALNVRLVRNVKNLVNRITRRSP